MCGRGVLSWARRDVWDRGRVGSCGIVRLARVRLNWVCEDEDVWDRACRVGSYVLVIGSERGRSSGAVRRVRAHRWLRGAWLCGEACGAMATEHCQLLTISNHNANV